MFSESPQIPITKINDPLLGKRRIALHIKREDLIDPYISGNKFRKLKYNLIEARKQGFHTLLTFGGAYSNHIHAVAYAGEKYNFNTIGIIRGEQSLPLNPTLRDAQSFGMKLHHISRTEYKEKNEDKFINTLKDKFGGFYLVPEGGSNTLAVKGCTEIVTDEVIEFDHICCASGTGGTLAGIIAGLEGEKKIWGFPALKNGGFLKDIINNLIRGYSSKSYTNWDLVLDYHFGGYAKFDHALIAFINDFNKKHKIPLDPVYTGKMVFGIYELINKGCFREGEKILAIHTGGLQGIRGFNERYGNLIH